MASRPRPGVKKTSVSAIQVDVRPAEEHVFLCGSRVQALGTGGEEESIHVSVKLACVSDRPGEHMCQLVYHDKVESVFVFVIKAYLYLPSLVYGEGEVLWVNILWTPLPFCENASP